MKKLVIFSAIFVFIVFSVRTYATEVGNGGGTWSCWKLNQDGSRNIIWTTLIDLFEGREEFHLNIPEYPNHNYKEIIGMQLERILVASPHFYDTIKPFIKGVFNSINLVNADLEIIDDVFYRIKPSIETCREHLEYLQLANFTHYGKTLIPKQLWENKKLLSIDRAALIFHEAIYKYLRETEEDTDSVRTRETVAYIFSDVESSILKNKLKALGLISKDTFRGMNF